MGQICVVVDNHNLEPLIEHSKGASGSLRLTTIKSGQMRALIEIKYNDGRRTVTLHSVIAEGLQGENPPLEVRGRIDGKYLKLEFLLREKVFHLGVVKLPGALYRPWWILLPAALAAAAIGLFFLPRSEKPQIGVVQEKPPPVEKAAPLRSPVPPAPAAEAATEAPPTAEPTETVPQPVFQTVYFLPDDYTVTTGARQILDELINTLGEEAEWNLEITGHCALAGTEKGRIDLSVMRASAVFSYLTTGGLASLTEPVVDGVGGSEPVTTDPELQHLNRRVEIQARTVANAAANATAGAAAPAATPVPGSS